MKNILYLPSPYSPSKYLLRTSFPSSHRRISSLIKLESLFLCNSLFAGRHGSVFPIWFDRPFLQILFLDVAKHKFEVLAFAFGVAHGQEPNGGSEDADLGDAGAGISEKGR